MYNLYLDKAENFECAVSVKNASLKDAAARVIIEGDGFNLMFPGNIKDGKCTVPIKKLKGLLEENAKGEMHLEMIVDDTYFMPWKDSFQVEEHTSVKVQVKEQVQKPTKPTLEVKVKKNDIEPSDIANRLLIICERFGINKKNFQERKADFKQIVKEYFRNDPRNREESKKYIMEAVSSLK